MASGRPPGPATTTTTSTTARGPVGTSTSTAPLLGTPGPTGWNDAAACRSAAVTSDTETPLSPEERKFLDQNMKVVVGMLEKAFEVLRYFKEGEFGRSPGNATTRRANVTVFLALKDIYRVDQKDAAAVAATTQEIEKVLKQIQQKVCGGKLRFRGTGKPHPAADDSSAGEAVKSMEYVGGDTIVMHEGFWADPTPALTLIHEAAHAVGIGIWEDQFLGKSWGPPEHYFTEKNWLGNPQWDSVETPEDALNEADSYAQFAERCRNFAAVPEPKAPTRQEFPGPRFGFDKHDLTPEGRQRVDAVVKFMKERPTATVTLTGHADRVGPEGHNQGLSERRAGAVRDYMSGQGIEGRRIRTQGVGESGAEGKSPAERAEDRRVDIVVTDSP